MSATIRELQAAAADVQARLLEMVPAEKRDYAHALIHDHLTYHAEIGMILGAEHVRRGAADAITASDAKHPSDSEGTQKYLGGIPND
jgi:hypothetical protein